VVIRAEEWMDIHKLVKDGVPISRIAELLGRDWKTVAMSRPTRFGTLDK
jgi:IS30 family transposase